MKAGLALSMMVLSCQAAPLLAPTPLAPAWHALLANKRPEAWQEAVQRYPSLSGQTQLQAWRQLVQTLMRAQCGRDMPVAVPPWLADLQLDLVQRDIPYSRVFRVTLRGHSERHNLSVSLRLPDGRETLANAALTADQAGNFEQEGRDESEAFPSGVYWLTVQSGGEQWQQALPITFEGALDWVSRDGRKVRLHLPPALPGCQPAGLQQSVMSQPGFATVWQASRQQNQPLRWPSLPDMSHHWASITVTQPLQLGSLSVRYAHRLAGPLAQF